MQLQCQKRLSRLPEQSHTGLAPGLAAHCTSKEARALQQGSRNHAVALYPGRKMHVFPTAISRYNLNRAAMWYGFKTSSLFKDN